MAIRNLLPKEPGLLMAVFSASQGIGMMAYWALPILIGAMAKQYNLTATQAGFIGTIEFLGVLTGSLALSPFVSRIPRRTFVFAGALIVVVANLASGLLMPDVALLRLLRFLSGVGAGLALAVGNATIANAKKPESLANYMTIILVIYMVIAMPGYAKASELYGFAGVCLALALTAFLSMLFLFNIPNHAALQAQTTDAPSDFSWFNPYSLVALFVIVLFGVRDTFPWLFSEQLGTEAGMSLTAIGSLFAFMYAVGLAGPVIALLAGRVLPQLAILLISVIVSGAFGVLIIISGGNAQLYQIGILVWAVAYFAAFAELAGFLAVLDKGGRLASAMGSALMLGIMITPAIGGYLFEAGGYWLVAVASTATTALMVAGLLLTARWRQHPAASDFPSTPSTTHS